MPTLKFLTLLTVGVFSLIWLAKAAATNDLSAARALAVPAGPGSGMYTLTTGDSGTTYLSWIEPAAGEHALKFSRLENSVWSAARLVAKSDNWFVNWADRPSVASLSDGTLMAHWLANTPAPPRANHSYGVKVAHSGDRGVTWREVFEAGMANVGDYTGFLAFHPLGDEFLAAYLTPLVEPHRNEAATMPAQAGHSKTVRVARFDRSGRLRSDTALDSDVCTCCPLAIATTSVGSVIVYRDHQAGEIRDISIVREVDGRWTEPATVHRDNWSINGCPTNGPSVIASGRRVAVAWFTAAGDQPRVRLASSTDAGASFAPPLQVDEGKPVGWPALVLLDDGSTVVSWLERVRGQDGVGAVRVRRVSPAGALEPPLTVATTASGRTAGMPQMVKHGRDLVLAWRSGERVESAILPIARLLDSSVR